MIDHPSNVQLVPFLPQSDLRLLRVWLDRAHVAPWWGDSQEALAYANEHPSAMHRIIALDGKPVGYVCWQSLGGAELSAAGLNALPRDHLDVDILLGEREYIGQGVGPAALLVVVEELQSLGVSSVGLATDQENQRALRAFEKAGFGFFHEFEEEGRRICYLTKTLESAVESR